MELKNLSELLDMICQWQNKNKALNKNDDKRCCFDRYISLSWKYDPST